MSLLFFLLKQSKPKLYSINKGNTQSMYMSVYGAKLKTQTKKNE